MEVTSTLVLLYKGFKFAHSALHVATFVSEEERLQEVLIKIGEQEYAAAKKSLEDAQRSQMPRREIESALTIFRIALERELQAEVKMVIALILSGIYRALDEESLTNKFLNLAKRYFEEDIDTMEQTIVNVKRAGKVVGGVEEAGKLIMKSMIRSKAGLFAGFIDKQLEEGEMHYGVSYEKRKCQAEELAEKLELGIKGRKEDFERIYKLLSS